MDAPRDTVARARALRRTMTPPELRLWSALRTRPDGFKFRRQHPFGPYVLDVFCDEAKLAVEVDGGAHDLPAQASRDLVRDAWLTQWGILVLRVVAEDVRVDLPGVVEGVDAPQPPPPRFARSPAPRGGGDAADRSRPL